MCEMTCFVQLIEKYPCLYNHTLSDYSRKDITEKAWNEVANEIKWRVADCKEKWRNIRNGFVRSLKPAASGSSAKQRRQYYLHDVMQFVLPFVKPITHIEKCGKIPTPPNEEIQQTEDRDDTTTDTTDDMDREIQNENTSRRKKLKFNEMDEMFIKYLERKTKNSTEDHRKMFLLSLLPDLHKLTDSEMREFKMKTLMSIDEILSRPRQEISHPYPFSPTSEPITHIHPLSPTSSVSQESSTPPSTYTLHTLTTKCKNTLNK
ncbi:uncharacterized protein LOC143360381 [Halictus rubicundus]|uniref:uncharacterized protein LOC143360381 n=1 Tax=Halictus rubicundus TaxID=77578 RepID=UPI0040351B90